jgi:hypothetical protein
VEFNVFVVVVALVVLFACGFVAIVGLLHLHREHYRILAHIERIKALEMGIDLPEDATTSRLRAISGNASVPDENTRGALARKCFSTALWVAFWGFVAAGSHAAAGMNPGVAYVIASATGAIGVTAMICGTILAVGASNPAPAQISKPVTEADAFDVVSSRG